MTGLLSPTTRQPLAAPPSVLSLAGVGGRAATLALDARTYPRVTDPSV